MKQRALLLSGVLSASVLGSTPSWAQSAGQPLEACPSIQSIAPSNLYGLWHFSFWSDNGSEDDPISRGAMLLEAHPEYPDSVRGQMLRSTPLGDRKAQVSGDVVEGELNLDESDDGVAMSAVWTGELSPTDCRLDFRGTRRPANAAQGGGGELRFRLHKRPEAR